jgi:hypothetical protein
MWPFNRKKKKPEPEFIISRKDIVEEMRRQKLNIGNYISAGISPSCSRLSGGFTETNSTPAKKRYNGYTINPDSSTTPIYDPTPYISFDSPSAPDTSSPDCGSDSGGGGSFDGGGSSDSW